MKAKIILFLFLVSQCTALAALPFSSTNVRVEDLPSPYHALMQQPLMTLSIEKYYQRRALLHKINSHWDKKTNIYSRTIIMLIDNNKKRNKVKIAKEHKTALIVELAFIKINFNALPEAIKKKILYTDLPLGKLLAMNKIATSSRERSYFAVKCEGFIAKKLPCVQGSLIYGRHNTLVRKSNGVWLAKVVEILSGIPS